MTRRVLAMWQPWATLFVARDVAFPTNPPPKGVETRHFLPAVPLPVDVVIHATKTWRRDLSEKVQEWPFRDCLERTGYYPGDPRPFAGRLDAVPRGLKPIPLGALIGVATIVAARSAASLLGEWSEYEDGAAEHYAEEVKLGNYDAGRFGWIATNQRELPRPITFIGQQSVLYPLPQFYEDQIEEQLAGVAP